MAVDLSDLMIRGYTTRMRKDLYDSKVTGLILRVTPSGARTWAVEYRANGRKRRYTLGPYKGEGIRGKAYTLAAARDEAETVLARVRLGADPHVTRLGARVEARRRAQEEKRLRSEGGPLTVERLVMRCLEALPLRPKTDREWRRLAKKEINPRLGTRLAVELSKGEVREWSRAIVRRSHYSANRAFEVLRAYTWGLSEDLVVTTPFLGLSKPGTEHESERVLSIEEISAVWRALAALDAEAATPQEGVTERIIARRARERRAYVDAVRLLFLTGVRRAMVTGANRAEFDGLDGATPLWTIPGGFCGRSKSGHAHVVPLSRSATAIVKRRLAVVPADALFPVGRRGPVTNGDPDAAMTWSSRFISELRAKANELHGAEMPRWTVHGVRHTIATHLRADLGVSTEVVSLILGHTPPGPRVTRIYNRADLLPERASALASWARWIENVAMGKHRRAAKVVALTRSAATS
jgi:integrase